MMSTFELIEKLGSLRECRQYYHSLYALATTNRPSFQANNMNKADQAAKLAWNEYVRLGNEISHLELTLKSLTAE